MKSFAVAVALLVGGLLPSVALATPRSLPFSYPNETLPKGAVEAELYTDVNPQRVTASPTDATAGNVWSPEYKLQTEIEVGLTDRFELGLYQVFEAAPAVKPVRIVQLETVVVVGKRLDAAQR